MLASQVLLLPASEDFVFRFQLGKKSGRCGSGVAIAAAAEMPDTCAIAIADMCVAAALSIGRDLSPGNLFSDVVPGAVGAAARGFQPVKPARMAVA